MRSQRRRFSDLGEHHILIVFELCPQLDLTWKRTKVTRSSSYWGKGYVDGCLHGLDDTLVTQLTDLDQVNEIG